MMSTRQQLLQAFEGMLSNVSEAVREGSEFYFEGGEGELAACVARCGEQVFLREVPFFDLD